MLDVVMVNFIHYVLCEYQKVAVHTEDFFSEFALLQREVAQSSILCMSTKK